jgi:DNA-directed RNA polymerase beta subunit
MPDSDGRVTAKIVRDGLPVVGDMFTTLHGQKGVITIMDDADMHVVDGHMAELIIGSSSIIKRETHSQVLEACYSQWIVDNMRRLAVSSTVEGNMPLYDSDVLDLMMVEIKSWVPYIHGSASSLPSL